MRNVVVTGLITIVILAIALWAGLTPDLYKTAPHERETLGRQASI